MNKTTNYDLNKPSGGDNVLPSDYNENMDIIDAEMKLHRDILINGFAGKISRWLRFDPSNKQGLVLKQERTSSSRMEALNISVLMSRSTSVPAHFRAAKTMVSIWRMMKLFLLFC